MKAYQYKWVVRLYEASTQQEIYHVCEKIIADDTGDTDELAQQLASKVLELCKQ